MIQSGLSGGNAVVVGTAYSRAEALFFSTAQTGVVVTMAGAGRASLTLGAVPAGAFLPIATMEVTAATPGTGIVAFR